MSTVEVECANCLTKFGISQDVHRQRNQDGKSFFCPNGHPLSFRETEIDRLKKKIIGLESDVSYYRTCWNQRFVESERMARRIRALRGVITRMKRVKRKGGSK